MIGDHVGSSWRAYQQDPDAVERWKTETYPAVRTEAALVGATIYFLDEAGVRSELAFEPGVRDGLLLVAK